MTDELRGQDAHNVLATDAYRRGRGFWRIATFLALALAIFALVGRFALPEGRGDDILARIVIDGTIATDTARVALIEELARDPRVRGVIVSINSGGGTTAGGEELYESLGALRQAKPVVAVIAETGASAAYMTAIATDRIFARRLSIVGSIGVLYQHVDAGRLLDTIGLDLDKVASGPLKAEPDLSGPMSAEARQSIAELVDDSYAWFVDVVAERRGLARAEVLALADGRIVSGRMGLDAGLIDATGGEAEARLWLAEAHGLPADLEIVTAWPRRAEGILALWRPFEEALGGALGWGARGPVALDGLVSLWQVD